METLGSMAEQILHRIEMRACPIILSGRTLSGLRNYELRRLGRAAMENGLVQYHHVAHPETIKFDLP